MPIPDFQTLMLPVLQVLSDGADHTARSVIEALSDEFELGRGEREQLVGSQRIGLMASRVHWAMTYLAQSGLTDRPRRGVWRITPQGTRLLATNPKRIDNTLLERYEGSLVDVGSGGGSPGIPLAATQPDRKVTLLDAERRKCDFLRRWAPPNAEVVWGRAEEQECQ